MAFKSKKKFEYRPRDADAVKARATAGGNREGFLAEGVRTFSPKAGTHTVRILPPTWEDADHYGYDVWAHYNVGVDEGAYLCLQKMAKKECAICNERARATRDDDLDLEALLKPRQRVACWIIDRENERDGVLMWLMPWTLDREISQQSIDKKSHEVYNLDNPDEGYDVSFERQGERMTTKYVGVQLDRRSSPLSDDDETAEEWLTFVAENPIPDQMVFQDEEYLTRLVGDGLTVPKNARDKAKGDDDKKKPVRASKSSRDDDDDEKPRGKKATKTKEAEPEEIDVDSLDWDAVHAMDEDELKALAAQEDIDIDDATDEEEAANIICKKLKIKEEEAEPPAKEKEKERPSMNSRLSALRNKSKK